MSGYLSGTDCSTRTIVLLLGMRILHKEIIFHFPDNRKLELRPRVETRDYSDVIYLVNVVASPHSVRADYQNIQSHQRTSQTHKYF